MKPRPGRSLVGTATVFLFLLLFSVFFMLPIVYAISTAFKPFNEIFIFPPRLFVRKPTFNNFIQLNYLVSDFWVPLSRYIFNSVFITIAGTFGHIVLASMAAYPLAKHNFYGQKVLTKIIVLSLLFTASVTYIPQYVILSGIGAINTYWALILPALQSSLGLYLMMNFMQKIPEEMLEAARIDGAKEARIFWTVVMPNVKPAWLTLMIFSFQGLWNSGSGALVFKEELKTLPSVMTTIAAGGVTRTGATAAAALILMIPPILLFIFSQSRIIETMSTSGLK
ncbi:MAG: carbohydrate ABC transporter permease [Oscillospiraceae bacterium]|nr:carbohydrate ABC transporter permease [Oscillospiraceae bacterium]MDD4545678.1 carbohydrate ABC transporter permease [Oscillospiraceae bacterium]